MRVSMRGIREGDGGRGECDNVDTSAIEIFVVVIFE